MTFNTIIKKTLTLTLTLTQARRVMHSEILLDKDIVKKTVEGL